MSAPLFERIEALIADERDQAVKRDLRDLLTLARSAPSAELVKLGEAAVKWANHTVCVGTAYDDRELFLEAARAYARSVEERGEQASISTTQLGGRGHP